MTPLHPLMFAGTGSDVGKSVIAAAFCFDNGIFNIYEVNMLLFQYDQPQLP